MNRPGTSRGLASRAVLVTGFLLATLTLPAGAAVPDAEAIKTAVRSGTHPTFGRIVIETNGASAYTLDQQGDHAVLRLQGTLILGRPPSPPRNVIAIQTDGATVELTMIHGTQLHPMVLDGRVVLDILDNPASPQTPPLPRSPLSPPLSMAASPELGGRSAPRAAATPERATPEQATPERATPERGPVEAQPLPPPLPAAQPAPEPRMQPVTPGTPPGRDVMPEIEGPVGLRARRIKLPKGMDGTGFLVPFDSTTGAASFSGGSPGTTYIVFDERRAVDLAALHEDAVFGSASISLLPGGTLLRVPHSAAQAIVLTQMPQGWRIAALTAEPKREPIAASLVDGRLNLAAETSSDVVTLADPDTGATLLVGTQRRPGQGVATKRVSTEFILRPTSQGIVVEPLSDKIALKQVPAGFILTGGPAGLALSPPGSATDILMEAANLTTRLDFPAIPTDALLRAAIRQIGDAAAAPAMARGRKHHAAAASLLALGLAAEAQSLLKMAAEQDPKEAASADTGALTAIAALLAGRTAEAGALQDPRLDGTDEIALWRAVRLAMLDEGSPVAAAAFATTAPLLFRYPGPIRGHILPLVAETMIQGGEITAAAHLLNQRKSDPGLAYARALMRQAEGDTGQALGMLDALANGHDQFDRARAAIRAVELRLATRELDKAQAADALDKLLYAWRGDARELALRERVAGLRGQSGAWQAALATLRQAETDFPEQAAPIHVRLKDLFGAMIRDHGAQQVPAIQFISTVDENTDLMPESEDDGEAVEQSLADRLLALDLPARAKPVLEKLLRSAKSNVAKARFGLSLATLDGREGNDAGARAVLDATEGRDLPPELIEQRAILRAESVARLGDPAGAAALLAALRTRPGIEARAQILENAADWAGAARAWTDCAALALPDSGMLDDEQTRIVLRLATATARAGDDEGLAGLRAKYGERIGTSPLGDMFRLLTVEPVRTTADIGRSKREMSLAAALPAGLKALRASVVAR